jgi:hypothetical protein
MPLYTLAVRTNTGTRAEAYTLTTETLALLADALDNTPTARAPTRCM